MSRDPHSIDEYVPIVEAWLARAQEESAATAAIIASVERDPEVTRWYVRMRGEEKLVTTLWLTLRDRSLHYETYFMPAPEENVAACYEYLLRVNARLVGMRFSIGGEDAIYLTGQLPLSLLENSPTQAADDALDEILGAAYAYSEECFRTAMSIGFASRFRR